MRGAPDIWNFFAPVYNLFMRGNRRAYAEMYARIRRAVAGREVLEIATGTGLIAKNVADTTARMVATDFAERMLRQARRGDCPAQLTFRQADATALPFEDGSFDAVIIANALHVIPGPERVLSEVRRVLRPGGLLIAPNFVNAERRIRAGLVTRALTALGIAFEARWDAAGYLDFLRAQGWEVRRQALLEAMIPLQYAECEAIPARAAQTD